MPAPARILASSSCYRRQLLDRLGLEYACVSPEVDESVMPGETPLQVCSRLARAKALAVAALHPEAVVIGSDQVCDLDGAALGKPGGFERALAQLKAMQGRSVVFHTAVCVARPGGSCEETVSDTRITMRRLPDIALVEYLRREEPYNCAGSAKIERLGIALMQSVESDDPTSLIGLPLMRLTSMLARAGVPVLRGLEA